MTGAPADKTYLVTLPDKKLVVIKCRWMFNNDGELLFRTGTKGNTTVVATFARGHWLSCIKQEDA